MLTYGFAGAFRLQGVLEREPSLACTSGTGILAACDAAARAWRNTEGQSDDEPLSALATSSIKALLTGMLTMIMARTGARRWCETAAAEPSAAETFLRIYPGTRFICLHRSCPDVVRAALRSSPWGLAGASFAPYLLQQPTSTTAALAAWWVNFAKPILDFEEKHPRSCLRIRYEDLVLDPGSTTEGIFDFIGLASSGRTAPGLVATAELPEDASETGMPGSSAGFPFRQLPPQLSQLVNELHAQLGYPPVSPAS